MTVYTALPSVTYEEVIQHYESDPTELGTQPYIEVKIAHTIAKLRNRYGRRILARLNSGLLDEEMFKATVAEAVLRVVRNPEGFTQEQQGNYSYGLRATVASGYLMFTEDNLLDLLGSQSPVIGTVTIGDHREG